MAYPRPPASSFPQNYAQIENESVISPSDTIVASSSSPFISTAEYPNNSNYCFDVVINHRGPDTKNTFASHLYHRLLSHGLRVFLDKPEMKAGDHLNPQLEGAIRSASVHIAIFSPKYAESKWCLNELLLMLKSEATIIPVFYHVKPEDLRLAGKGGAYTEALFKHKEKKTEDPETGEVKSRYDPKTIENWRKALCSVADISGLNLDDCNGDEGELLNKVLVQVQRKVKGTPLNVATYPTGLKKTVEDLDKTISLQQQSGQGQVVVGIVGLGGIGKTTLAKEFFNRRRTNYDASCFLFEVREAAIKSSLSSLQCQLLRDLTQYYAPEIRSIDEGIEMLKGNLSSTQALIILDDVDHASQLEALFLPVKDVLRPGSLILVTSRNKDLLTRSGIVESAIYKLTGLDRRHSQELFCSHAFHQPRPCVGFEELVTKFLDACDGLPLSLKVIGALLHGNKDFKYWNAQLSKISRVIPTDIQSRLIISYDSLDEEEKEIFLDIACFFVGEDKDMVIRIWEGCNWEGLVGITSLQSKCLIEVDSENRIRMHDNIRDLGRSLADKERLWRRIDSFTLQNVLRQSSVRGIGMVHRNFERPFELRNCSVDMSGLQLLRAEGDCLESISTGLGSSPDLIWLCWYNCPYSFLPSWLPLKKLRVLQVTGEETLETLWQSPSEAPKELRELNVNVGLLQLPMSIGQLEHLEKIELEKGTTRPLPKEFYYLCSLKHLRMPTKMWSLPNLFGNLANLQYLDLSWSTNLLKLPHSFGNLTKLQHLDLSLSSNLRKLPQSFGNLIQLEHLCLAGCSELSISAGVLGNITTLVSLDLSCCLKMDVLPPQVARQQFLKELNLLGTRLRVLRQSDIADLGHLEALKLGSPFLKMLPPLLGALTSLKELTLFECNSLECLPDSVRELKQLTRLEIHFSGIMYLPMGVTEMNNLEFLKVHSTPLLAVPFAKMFATGTEISTETVNHKCMIGLRYLELYETRVSELSFVEGMCPNLQHLKIGHCNDLKEVGALPTSLITLEMLFCGALWKIGGLCGLANLLELDIRGCQKLEELPSLETLTSLEELRASKCNKLKSIPGLGQQVKLRLIEECSEIEESASIGIEELAGIEC